MDIEKLQKIIESHQKWLKNEIGGEKADLAEADLPNRIIQVGPVGSRKSYTIYNIDADIVQCGCWNDGRGGSLSDFKKRVDAVYPNGKYRQEYLAVIAMFEMMSKKE